MFILILNKLRGDFYINLKNRRLNRILKIRLIKTRFLIRIYTKYYDK